MAASFVTEQGTGIAITLPNVGISFKRTELTDRFYAYDKIDDCLKGAEAVKSKQTVYLPMPDPANTSTDNLARYRSYIQRAIFYNVTQRTALGLQGQIFIRAPVIEVPAALENVVTNSNGSGIGAEQLSREAEWYAGSFGRCGIFIDYPPVDRAASKAELANGNVQPTITIYGPKNVINWREKVLGSKKVLCLVVLVETYTVQDDGFETQDATQYRELRLSESNVYSVQLWRAKDPKGTDFEKFGAPYFPKDGAGKPLDSIPFTFVGSKNNEASIDPAPLEDLVNVNIGHYCNSADYEEMIYVVGQPMLVVSGLTAEWYNAILNKKVPFGSRIGLPLPIGAKAELIQVEPNTAAKEGMEAKERQMVALGAKIVEQKTVQRTATEAGMENAAEESILAAVAKNVSVAMQWALEWCAAFMNVPETDIKFELNTDFELSRMSGEEIALVVKSWQDGALSWTEMRNIQRKAGRTSQTDEEAKAEIDKDQSKAIADAALEIGATTKAVADNTLDEPAA